MNVGRARARRLSEPLGAHGPLLVVVARVERAAEAELLERLLAELEDELVRHFAAEEQEGGLFDVLLGASTATARAVARLRGEHAWFLLELARALGALAGRPADSLPARLGSRVRMMCARLRDHERAEQALWQEALERDLGAVD
jgi:hypothetical protein